MESLIFYALEISGDSKIDKNGSLLLEINE